MGKEEKTIKSNVIYKGRILSLNCDDVLAANGKETKREVVHHNGGVCILAFKDDKVVLIKQFRYSYKQEMFELPAGKLEKGEDAYEAGIRELEEEVGLKAESLTSLGYMYPSCGYTNEIIYLYKANNVTPVERHLDEDDAYVPWDERHRSRPRGAARCSRPFAGFFAVELRGAGMCQHLQNSFLSTPFRSRSRIIA